MDKAEQFYQQVTESIKLVFDLTSRIDERVKNLVEQLGESQDRIDRVMDKQEAMTTRIAVLENKNGTAIKEEVAEIKKNLHALQSDEMAEVKKAVHALEVKMAGIEWQSGSHENKWKLAGDFVFKLILAALGAFFAWKLSSH